MKPFHFYSYGNSEILKHHKIAFLCSRTCPAHVILKAYDWAGEQRDKGVCVISGFHSQIEKDVLHYLLKGRQPIILALARGMKQRLEPEIGRALREERLLIVTPFDESMRRASAGNAQKRNRLMADLADRVFVAHAAAGGNVEKLLRDCRRNGKPVATFDLKENQHLIKEGTAIYP